MKKNIVRFLSRLKPIATDIETKKKLKGKWEEEYGVGANTNLFYNDTYYIDVDEFGAINISSKTSPNNIYNKIHYYNGELSFEIKIEVYTIPYVLKFNNKTTNMLEGHSINRHGVNRMDIWRKI